MNRTNWEFTYTGQVLAEVAKKRIEEIRARIQHEKDFDKTLQEQSKNDPYRSYHIPQWVHSMDEIRELEKWLFVFEKHPENKHDLDRDDFIYFFESR